MSRKNLNNEEKQHPVSAFADRFRSYLNHEHWILKQFSTVTPKEIPVLVERWRKKIKEYEQQFDDIIKALRKDENKTNQKEI